eukprot:TRINITY_DN7320_c0_g2_i1.p1 TRINITY_DN7320_c0_g2~~TRINITY_DN7320_c0_g2_i1.p1  ORF type:complete len:115 (-),score=56.15 TRINITY_DN7320_c0_g2_i1:45-389(-)
MKENETSKIYVGQRIREIVEENVAAERKVQIRQLMHDLAFSQSEKAKLEKMLKSVEAEKEELQRAVEESVGEKEECEMQKAALEEQVNKLQNDIATANTPVSYTHLTLPTICSV